MSHTPGPWRVAENLFGNTASYEVYSNAETKSGKGGYTRICQITPRDQKDNAHLIAAAPEMLAALTEVEIELDAYPHCPLCGHVHGGHRQNCVGHLVNVAIKKAEDDNGKKNDEEATVEYSGGNSNPDRLLKQHIRREYKRTKHPGKARGAE